MQGGGEGKVVEADIHKGHRAQSAKHDERKDELIARIAHRRLL